ncbi:hypothetical protein [Armatimonas rosea]|uniref:PBP1b-binding outer membrane lipoprotein LpoB n=1 Tax=Armatimonas rosea TaxID=685828 RepID=A0A7W9SQ75_ARMRO|nr:hypothetical protein [Armatimonas rosea]MBB6050184.1 PBP1b-binding outer membrane lipoprotein LpoB [Armatimonas rosea]
MTKTHKLSLIIAALAALSCLVGCKTEQEPVKDDPKALAADAAKSGGAPAQLPAEAQGQMSKALNDPNTPPEVKAKIQAQMGGGK